ncbi:polymorphic toxin type 8 domain-containing protein [Emticicia sp. TH156]|uniref:polymorphic toxin type 8 domain-containing protein n=1 Tax=Emticicia sp. TH156 TaxID=2067454 RepID=UPI000C78F3FE|nr:polymorphic toxin type 8 domain-containing protein [Emticicia sp. TH156]PLK42112.1 hypothetical protein C0V77_22630 [Emticicia sp. TH156]
MIRLGARGYNPTIGRFDRVDPVIEGQEQLSLYQYGWNNPVLRSDPDGNLPLLPWLDAVVDVAFVVYDAGVLIHEKLTTGKTSKENWAALAADGLSIAVPMSVGAGMAVKAGMKAANKVDNAADVVKTTSKVVENANDAVKSGDNAKSLLKQGRSGKQERLKEIANDPKASSADRGWIKQDMNEIAKGKRENIRNPPGKDLAHERGREAAKGYSYEHSNLQDRDLHRQQHKHDNYGRKNKERPL